MVQIYARALFKQMARVQSRRRRHLCVGSVAVSRSCYDNSPGGGGDSAYERGGDAGRKF